MKAILPLIAVTAALTLAACSKKADEPEVAASTAVSAGPNDATPAAEPTQSEAAPTPSPTATPTPTASETAAADKVPANEIPKAIRGRWGMVAKDCTSKLGDAKGLLTISAAQLKFYESVAKLGKVKESDDSRIRATFSYSGEGQTWIQDVVLDVQDGGKTMIRRDYGPDALPGPQKYTRCT